MHDAAAFIAVITDVFRRLHHYIRINAHVSEAPPAAAGQTQTFFLIDTISQHHKHIVVAVGTHVAVHSGTEQKNLLRPRDFFDDLRD